MGGSGKRQFGDGYSCGEGVSPLRVAGIPRLREGKLCPRFKGRMPATNKSKAKMASPRITIAEALLFCEVASLRSTSRP
ncbi:MAG: hypothetical protein A2Y76_04195 [Planctomycetes bacterium RBG_13_60_9]|nr:MAG: hypothetical protein A2Y76_04195 [Planctomycetes bacterium RBG_13_60_9]